MTEQLYSLPAWLAVTVELYSLPAWLAGAVNNNNKSSQTKSYQVFTKFNQVFTKFNQVFTKFNHVLINFSLVFTNSNEVSTNFQVPKGVPDLREFGGGGLQIWKDSMQAFQE